MNKWFVFVFLFCGCSMTLPGPPEDITNHHNGKWVVVRKKNKTLTAKLRVYPPYKWMAKSSENCQISEGMRCTEDNSVPGDPEYDMFLLKPRRNTEVIFVLCDNQGKSVSNLSVNIELE